MTNPSRFFGWFSNWTSRSISPFLHQRWKSDASVLCLVHAKLERRAEFTAWIAWRSRSVGYPVSLHTLLPIPTRRLASQLARSVGGRAWRGTQSVPASAVRPIPGHEPVGVGTEGAAVAKFSGAFSLFRTHSGFETRSDSNIYYFEFWNVELPFIFLFPFSLPTGLYQIGAEGTFDRVQGVFWPHSTFDIRHTPTSSNYQGFPTIPAKLEQNSAKYAIWIGFQRIL